MTLLHTKQLSCAIHMSMLICFFLTLMGGQAQYGMEVFPRPSHDKGTYQRIGYTNINIRYGSPSVKGRKVWGELVPYGEVWRAGANNATTIEFSRPVKVEGQSLSAGKYSFFILPKELDRWTLIFNRTHDQWGAFRYEADKDELRIEVLPTQANFVEELEYEIESRGPDLGRVSLHWDRLKIGFEVETNHLDFVEEILQVSVDDAEESLKWVSYLEGALYLLQQDKRLPLAMEWINTAETLANSYQGEWPAQYMPNSYLKGHLYWVKAQLYAKNGDFATALESASKMKQLKGDYLFYDTQAETQGIDTQISAWEMEKG